MGAMFDSLDLISRLLLEAMLNGIWQGVLIVALVWGMLRVARTISATTRHAVWLVSLLAIAALPVIGLIAKGVEGLSSRAVAEPTPRLIVRRLESQLPTADFQQPAERLAGLLEKRAESQPATGNRQPATTFQPTTGNRQPATTFQPTTDNRQPTTAFQPTTDNRQPTTLAQPTTGSWRARILDRLLAGRLPVALMGLWAGLAGLMIARIVGSYVSIYRLRRQLGSVPEPQVARMRRLAMLFGIGRRVRLFSSAEISMPMTIGAFKPMVLLPPGLADTLSEKEFDSVIAHELAHIKRWDYMTNLLQRLGEAVFFFHPGVWFIGKQLMIERELACDDWAVKTCEPRGYASCLTKLVEHWNASKPGTAVRFAATGILFGKHVLTRRVEMILNRDRNATTAVSKPALVYAVGAAVSFIIVCSLLSPVIAVPSGQKPARPKKEKRDARPAPAPGRVGESLPPEPPEPAEAPTAPEAPLPPIAVVGEVDWDEDLLPPDGPEGPLAVIAPAAPVAPVPPEFFGHLSGARGLGDSSGGVFGQVGQGQSVAVGGGVSATSPSAVVAGGWGQDAKKTPAIPEAELLNVLVEIVKKDTDPTVRQEALQGIYRMRSDAAVNALIGLYDSQSDVKVKSEIIAYMIRRNADNSKAVAKLLSIAKSEQNEELRNRAIRYLGAVPGDDGANNLIQIYDSLQEQKAKMSVIRSLGSNRSRKAIDKLIQIAKNDSDPMVRQAAVRSLNSEGRSFPGLTLAPGARIGQLQSLEAPFAFEFDNQKLEQMQRELMEKNREMIDKLRIEGIENFKFDSKRLEEMLRKLEIEMPKIELRMKEFRDGGLNNLEGESPRSIESRLRSHRAQLRGQLEAMRGQYTDTHPKVLETRKMLQSVEKEIEELQQLTNSRAPRPVRVSSRASVAPRAAAPAWAPVN
ncbi:MAG: M56 family metallopeptidase [Blastocatellia bacterium]|nr:M56 family metallopeptidase [Blastocatellia bacterium]